MVGFSVIGHTWVKLVHRVTRLGQKIGMDRPPDQGHYKLTFQKYGKSNAFSDKLHGFFIEKDDQWG